MNKVLYIILISLFSLTVISCSEKDESSSSSDSSITLSDVSANIAGSKYINRFVLQECGILPGGCLTVKN